MKFCTKSPFSKLDNKIVKYSGFSFSFLFDSSVFSLLLTRPVLTMKIYGFRIFYGFNYLFRNLYAKVHISFNFFLNFSWFFEIGAEALYF